MVAGERTSTITVRIDRCFLALRIRLGFAADKGHVWVGCQSGRENANPEIGGIGSTASCKLRGQGSQHRRRESRVQHRAAGHGVDLAVQELVAAGVHLLDHQVVLERIVVEPRWHAHDVSIGSP